MEQGGVKEHTRLGVVTIMQDYRYLGRGKNLALITEPFRTYIEPLAAPGPVVPRSAGTTAIHRHSE